ncbi:MAG: YcjX family protein [Hyphomicrobiaceae bacterium]|nr:YcjX family protein [Hyphomicrobiaceae bacterium]
MSLTRGDLVHEVSPLRFPDLSSLSGEALLQSASAYFSDAFTPNLRLGVTGLSRSGKTVFITALIRNLVTGGRLPFFEAMAERRITAAHLQPQPDDAVPRFDYEAHIAALSSAPPNWPDGTRHISELRVSIDFAPETALRRAIGVPRLNVDIVDYPGEWLIDLGMLDQNYAAWSAEAMHLAREPLRAAAAAPWLAHVTGIDASRAEDEQTAITGARSFTAYLHAARGSRGGTSTLSPGRFLMPGDLSGSPLLTFFPLDLASGTTLKRGSLGAMMERRFESYKSHVVRPFFRDHFSRLDRQIVLVDVLAALNEGPAAVADLQRALEAALRAFRPGANSFLSLLMGRRIDKLLFAATKADHLHHTSHDRLEGILRLITDRAIARATTAGADVGVMALAALRATREAEVKHGGERLPCIAGTPLPGERIDGRTFDGIKEAAIFPGDLPADPRIALEQVGQTLGDAAFVRFRPARVQPAGATGETPPLPHIRLDRAMQFLLGDRLA